MFYTHQDILSFLLDSLLDRFRTNYTIDVTLYILEESEKYCRQLDVVIKTGFTNKESKLTLNLDLQIIN